MSAPDPIPACRCRPVGDYSLLDDAACLYPSALRRLAALQAEALRLLGVASELILLCDAPQSVVAAWRREWQALAVPEASA